MRITWRTVLGNLGLAVISLLFVLVSLEMAFRVIGYSTLDEIYSKAHQFWDHDPALGWVHRSNVSDTFVGPLPWPLEYESRVTLNSLGLRGGDLAAVPEGGFRVLFTGDSRTAGFEVEDDETFSAILAELLEERLGRPVQTLNAGVRGYGTDQSLLAFRERWRSLGPDLVVHLHSYNDPADNTVIHQARRIYGKPVFVMEGGRERLVGSPVPIYPRCAEVRLTSAAEVVRFDTARTRLVCRLQLAVVDRSALLSFVQARIQQRPDLMAMLRALRTPEGVPGERRYEDSEVPRGPRREPRYELTRRLLRSYAEDVQRAGGRLLVAGYGPGWIELGADALASKGVEAVDVSEIEHGDPMAIRFVNDGHWNPVGHRRVAEVLAPHLVESLGAAGPASGSRSSDSSR